MRATEYLFLVIVIGIMAMVIIATAIDLNNVYPSNQIDTNTIDEYNDFEGIMNTANKTLDNFQKLGDDSKWYQKIGAGIVAIPYAVISFPMMIVEAVLILTKFMGGGLIGFIPAGILVAMVALLTVEIVRRMLEFFQRSRA